MTDLDEMERIARAATQGERWADRDDTDEGDIYYALNSMRGDDTGSGFIANIYSSKADADFAATFDPPTVLALIAQARENEALRAALKPFAEIGARLSEGHAESWFDIDTADGLGLRGRNFHRARAVLTPTDSEGK